MHHFGILLQRIVRFMVRSLDGGDSLRVCPFKCRQRRKVSGKYGGNKGEGRGKDGRGRSDGGGAGERAKRKGAVRDARLPGKNGGDLLSHLGSTIGVTGLNFSVRNGKRWNPGAIAT